MPVLRTFARATALLIASWSFSAAAEPSFVPVYRDNFPDPHIVLNNGQFIAYSTNDGPNLPMLTSPDLVHWTQVTSADGRRADGMPQLPSWAKEGRTWAPEVMQVGGKWLLYFTAADAKLGKQCVGVAVAAAPTGPFVDLGPKPLVCQVAEGGTIDASPFRDADGKLYLYYKSDGNAVGKRTFIWGQQLSADGLSVAGDPVALVQDDAKWEWRLVEAPSMVKSPGGYQLFFSAAFYGWDFPKERLSNYATGYADCSGPLGPCKDAAENPLLHSFNDRQAGCLSGPGHPAIFQVGKQHFIAFHAWAATSGCRPAEGERYLYVAPLFWKDGKPTIGESLRETKAPERG
jgi:beta-xylosidase